MAFAALNISDYLKSSRLTITHLQLYSLVGHGVRWFGDLTCDFAEVFGERFFWGSKRHVVRSELRTPRVETYRDDGLRAEMGIMSNHVAGFTVAGFTRDVRH